jgi:hypothetical protein
MESGHFSTQYGDYAIKAHNFVQTKLSFLEKTLRGLGQAQNLAAADAQAGVHFVVQQTLTGSVGLPPDAINDHLWNGALANLTKNLVKGCGIFFHINFGIGYAVGFQKLFGGAAIPAPLS